MTGADVEAHLDRQSRAACATWVHLDGFQVAQAARALPALRHRGVRLSAHMTDLAESWRTADGLLQSRRLFDLVFLDREVARAMASAGDDEDHALVARLDALVQRSDGPRDGAVLLTLGPGGAALLRPGARPRLAPAEPTSPIDTTGAGDAFTGLFLALHLAGRDLDVALRGAVRGATLSVGTLGAQGRRISAEDLGLDEAAPAVGAG